MSQEQNGEKGWIQESFNELEQKKQKEQKELERIKNGIKLDVQTELAQYPTIPKLLEDVRVAVAASPLAGYRKNGKIVPYKGEVEERDIDYYGYGYAEGFTLAYKGAEYHGIMVYIDGKVWGWNKNLNNKSLSMTFQNFGVAQLDSLRMRAIHFGTRYVVNGDDPANKLKNLQSFLALYVHGGSSEDYARLARSTTPKRP